VNQPARQQPRRRQLQAGGIVNDYGGGENERRGVVQDDYECHGRKAVHGPPH